MTTKATLKDWFLLTRPWSVTATLVPFLVAGGALKALFPTELGLTEWMRWTQGFVSGLFLLAACNLFNTWGDERSGVDRMPGTFLTTPQIQQGRISMRQTLVFAFVCLGLAAAIGLPLLFWRTLDGWAFNGPLFGMALVGFVGATNYSTGWKYKYRGLGVPFVALLEGTLYILVVYAIMLPTYVVQLFAEMGPWDLLMFAALFLVSLPIASLVGVILHGNDMRDIATDRAAGIRTLAAALKPRGALRLFITLHLFPYVALAAGFVWLFALGSFNCIAFTFLWPLLLPFIALPLTVRLLCHAVRDYRQNPVAPAWLGLEKGSGGIHFAFGVLYALALFLAN